MACMALTQLAWEGAAPDERVVGYRDGQAVTRGAFIAQVHACLLYTSPSPRDRQKSRMPSSA